MGDHVRSDVAVRPSEDHADNVGEAPADRVFPLVDAVMIYRPVNLIGIAGEHPRRAAVPDKPAGSALFHRLPVVLAPTHMLALYFVRVAQRPLQISRVL